MKGPDIRMLLADNEINVSNSRGRTDSHDNITLNSLRAQSFVPALRSGKLKAML
jgi:hypothetical protein